MKKTQKLEANRNIKDQLSSFISIVVIAMLAVTVYLGIAFSARAMDVNISITASTCRTSWSIRPCS